MTSASETVGIVEGLRAKIAAAEKNQTGGKLNRAKTVTLSVCTARTLIAHSEQQAATIAELRELLRWMKEARAHAGAAR